MRVTLRDIAKQTGYSVTTVSRALTGYDDVNEATRQHILEIADKLGYQPNLIARQLQGQRSHTLGLIMPARPHHVDDDFFSILLKGITYEAARNGYDVLVSAIQPGRTELDTYRRLVGGKRVDGLVLARTHRNDPRIEYLSSVKFPFIVHGRNVPDQPNNFAYIDVDSQLGIRLLVEHFIESGHRQIGIILPDEDIAFTPYRLAGYQEALAAAGIPFDEANCIHSDLTYRGGKQAALDLLWRQPQISALACCNDWMALGAMAAAQELKLVVGRDIAIGGYDDIPAASRAQPSLTTVRQPIYEIGEQLTTQLVQMIENAPEDDPQLMITPELIVRESSGAMNQQ